MKKKRVKKIIIMTACVLLAALGTGGFLFWKWQKSLKTPEELLNSYVTAINKKDYEGMYQMLDSISSGKVSLEEFTERNKKIYEGIQAENVKAVIDGTDRADKKAVHIKYRMTMDTVAGEIAFENEAVFNREPKVGYRMYWDDTLIFPKLTETDKVRVTTREAGRGRVLDRNGKVLAGQGTASQVGLVPGKMAIDPAQDLAKLAQLLDTTAGSIQDKLDAQWVKADSFVPIKIIEKIDSMQFLSGSPSEAAQQNAAIQEELLKIPGVMITDVEVRSYPLGESASHLVGYVQNVTAEDLEEHQGEGYSANSVIGRSGMEALYEKELKGTDGQEIDLVDSEGSVKQVLAVQPVKNGEDITLTIDTILQKKLWEQYQEDKSCSVAMNPKTGEVLALVSTPSYNGNDFILGMSQKKWDSLNDDENRPLNNRFRQLWCPGSSFKPVVAGIGVDTGAIDPQEDFGSEGLKWQKDDSWGSYFVTTLHGYEPVILENALIYSDNIYFAKAALKMGAQSLAENLDKLGFNQKLPFEITMEESKYSNTETIETEIQLADSGYGQGQMMVNPLHLAALYTAFTNQGNVLQPYLEYQENPQPKVWLQQAFTTDTAALIEDALTQVVNHPQGTGYGAHREDRLFAGKTGTAEIKESQDDKTGTELGWFCIYTADDNDPNPILLLSMVEDVKERGGSGYVVEKARAVLAEE